MREVNILMVDDHPENLLALEAVLSPSNYHLVKVNSGEDALKWVLKEDFAVILLDVQMPGLDGFETARLIKAREKSKDIPIIFVTAISQAVEHVRQGYTVGGIDYIFKPFEPETLIKKVEGFVKIHQTLRTVREQSALLRAITDASADTILSLDLEGHILNLNPTVKEMFNYQAEELLGEHVSQLLPWLLEKSLSELLRELNSVTEKRKTMPIEATAIHKNGQTFPVDISIGKAHVDDQHILVFTIRDITERKQMEKEREGQFEVLEKLVQERTMQIRFTNQKLSLSEKRFRKTFESSPNLMTIRSLKDGRYIDVNESWENHTEYRCEEIRNRRLDLFQLIEDSTIENPIPELDLVHAVRNVKVSYNTKSGKRREGLLSTETLELEGEPCLLTVVTDITERLILEQEMARLDRLNVIGEMAAGIAHEIRNPMTTVRGFLQMMRARLQHIDNNEFFDLMIEELDRANSIITEFLTLSKNQTLELDRHNLNEVLETLFPLIQADAFNCKKDVRLELGNIPDLVFAEREIRQMVLNLARNGLEAMPHNATLKLRTYQQTDEIILEVEDQGGGIEPETLQKIGTPFFTTKENGTGLGLAVCYGIAEKHNARISINTGPQGTTFYVHFPLDSIKLNGKQQVN
jgi:PAS domain S-box-containing protein